MWRVWFLAPVQDALRRADRRFRVGARRQGAYVSFAGERPNASGRDAASGPGHARHAKPPDRQRGLRHRQARDRVHIHTLSRPAVDRGDRRPCRPLGLPLPARLQALGRADAEGVPAGDHHRAGARAFARFGERARRRLRRRPLRPEPAARPVRRPRGADAGRLPARRSHSSLRLPPFAVRRGDRRRGAARHGRPRLRRRGKSRARAGRHGAPLAARAA